MAIDMLRARGRVGVVTWLVLLLIVVVSRRGVIGIRVVTTRWHVRGWEWEVGWRDSIVAITRSI